MCDDATMVLAFQGVSLAAPSTDVSSLEDVSFRLAPGGFLGIEVDDLADRLPVADLAEGLLGPGSGSVRFLGKDWNDLPPFDQERLRVRIGRVFDGQAWISNLNVDENVLLGALHGTLRSSADLRAEAESLATHVGLPALPVTRPEVTRAPDLARAQWVRAGLGERALIILERAESAVSVEQLKPLVSLVAQWRARGIAVLWIGTDWPAIRRAGLAVGPALLANAGHLRPIEGEKIG